MRDRHEGKGVDESRPKSQRVADWATILVAVCAVIVTGILIKQQLSPQGQASTEDHSVAKTWDDFLSGGHRIGPVDAAVTIVEFGDYECPFCQELEPILRAVLLKYPEDVALVYRFSPIPYHENAYFAARVAECAAQQDLFHPAHTLLYDLKQIDSIDPMEFGRSIGVGALDEFVACAAELSPTPGIAEDIEAGNRLGINSVPTVAVNGLLLGRTPDSARLSELVREALGSEGAGSAPDG